MFPNQHQQKASQSAPPQPPIPNCTQEEVQEFANALLEAAKSKNRQALRDDLFKKVTLEIERNNKLYQQENGSWLQGLHELFSNALFAYSVGQGAEQQLATEQEREKLSEYLIDLIFQKIEFSLPAISLAQNLFPRPFKLRILPIHDEVILRAAL